MGSWRVKNLGDAMLAFDQQARIEQRLMEGFAEAGRPTDMAAFIRHESEGRLHCDVKLYFSPKADTFAQEVNAQACHKPSPDGLSLLVGSEDCWRLLFPEVFH